MRKTISWDRLSHAPAASQATHLSTPTYSSQQILESEQLKQMLHLSLTQIRKKGIRAALQRQPAACSMAAAAVENKEATADRATAVYIRCSSTIPNATAVKTGATEI